MSYSSSSRSSKSLILLACLCVLASSTCPVFYTDYNQQGQSFELCKTGPVPDQYANDVSSFVVPDGYTVEIGGLGQGFDKDYTAGSYNVPANQNDKITSVRIVNNNDPSPKAVTAILTPTWPSFVDIFSGQNSQGQTQRFSKNPGKYDVPSQFANNLNSFRVGSGVALTLYPNANQQGTPLGTFQVGQYNVPSQNVNGIKSLAIVAAPACPSFYTDKNLQGSSFQLCSSGNVPSALDDQTSSFCVPDGYSVTIYPASNQSGQGLGPYTIGCYNLNDFADDRISSAAVTKTSN